MKPGLRVILHGSVLLSVMLRGAMGGPTGEDLAPLRKMIDQGKTMHSLSADITETRNLRALDRPLVSKGRLWFAAPSSFRWENGGARKTILIGNAGELFEIRHAESKRSFKRLESGMSPMMGPLGIPGLFTGDHDAFLRAFRVETVTVSSGVCHAEMTPLGGGPLRGVSSIHLDFNTQNGRWIRLRIITRDGSSLLQEFSNVRTNPVILPELFDPHCAASTP